MSQRTIWTATFAVNLLACVTLVLAGAALLWFTRDRGPPRKAAEEYLLEALAHVRAHHINAQKLDWPKIISQSRSKIRGAESPQDTYATIRWVLEKAGERHSFFLTPSQVDSAGDGDGFFGSSGEFKLPSGRLFARDIGALHLPGLITMGRNGATRGAGYAAKLSDSVAKLAPLSSCGWLVDLRGNTGGNMWPMLQGVEPLLGASPIGFFVKSSGRTEDWPRVGWNWRSRVPNADKPVAVLLDNRTASSGEMVAIAFLGRPNVRTFGAPTAGFTTGNASFPMSDGALLLITGAFARDRAGRDYSGPIQPDMTISPSEAQSAAAAWLKSRCRSA